MGAAASTARESLGAAAVDTAADGAPLTCKLSDDQVTAFANSTNFTPEERVPDGVGFTVKESLYVDRIFQLFDTNNDNFISFDEFLQSVSVLSSKGGTTEKIKFSFDILDFDRDGKLSSQELLSMLEACIQENGINIPSECLTMIVAKTMEDVDLDKDGFISFDEFRVMTEANLQMLNHVTFNVSAIIAEYMPALPRDAALHAGDRRLVFACWFADSRRRRYAKGFYSCSRVPQMPRTEEQTQPQEEKVEQQKEQEEQAPVTAAVAPVALESLESLPAQLKKLATAPLSETESEDDDSELEEFPTEKFSGDRPLVRAPRWRLEKVDPGGHPLEEQSRATFNADVKESNRRVLRRRADTGMTSSTKHNERSRRATFASKQDALAASTRSSSDRVEDALRSDGYWIGDFRVQRRLVSRRSTQPRQLSAGGRR
ncbi:EF-Hand 1, calcium-binding site [Phytophthora cactorum]|nr:EF-Hand 1, calcium-binding site [Phytophthora cactorum]